MIVASTIVPVVMRIPLPARYRFHRVQHPSAQFVCFQQMAEVQDRGLIRDRRAAQIDTGEAAEHR